MTRALDILFGLVLMFLTYAIADTWKQARETNRFIESIVETISRKEDTQ